MPEDNKCSLIIAKERASVSGYRPVFISGETHTQLKELSAETGLPMNRLTEKFIAFAMERLTLVGD